MDSDREKLYIKDQIMDTNVSDLNNISLENVFHSYELKYR
jgi:hypothetical protein